MAYAPWHMARAQGGCAADSEPNVLIVLDRSGSMRGDKWDDATDAVRRLTRRYEDRMRFGLMLFPSRGDCGVADAPAQGCASNTAAAIDRALDLTDPGGGSTPIGNGIDRGRRYLNGIAERGRRSAIVVISDGEEACGSRPVSEAGDAWSDEIPVFVIAFGGVDTDRLDDIAAAGGTAEAIPAGDGQQLLDALGDIAAELDEEICNGIDDDCDGVIDEDFPEEGEACDDAGLGVCAPGVSICAGGALGCAPLVEPMDERCNHLDDDCDGASDEDDPEGGRPCVVREALGPCALGLTRCEDGGVICVPDAAPTDEVCNLIDDDCDGVVDELPLPDVGRGCESDAPGQCAPGTWMCVDGEVICEPLQAPLAEQCDGLDNDCDGVVDNDVQPPFGEGLCATGMAGRCAAGQRVCSFGGWACNPERVPAAEICDGLDDDCDGRVDEALRNACGLCGEAPPAERCDGVDQDCDGRTDEEAPCPGAAVCVRGACVDPCPPNRECTGGRVCRRPPAGEAPGEFCFDPCAVADCAAGWRCEQGACVDPCAGVDCAADQRCRDGACVAADCAVSGCLDGRVCRAGSCVPHPCDGVECAVEQACVDGRCVDSCATIACGLDEQCVEGECRSDPCGAVTCGPGQICRDGACADDPCAGIACEGGQRCVDGFCGADPCATARCPRGERCVAERGRATCAPGWVETDDCGEMACPEGSTCAVVAGAATCVAPEGEADDAEPPSEGQPDGAVFDDADGGPGGSDGSPVDAGGEPDPPTEGCACDAAGGAPGSGAFAVGLLLLGWRARRRARPTRRA